METEQHEKVSREIQQMQRQLERERLKNRVLGTLVRHTGRSNVIGMGELYELVFGKPWQHRINDTSELRGLIRDMKSEGIPICSQAKRVGGGYYLASVGSELEEYLVLMRSRALKLLAQEAKLRRMALPELLGQIHMRLMEGAADGPGSEGADGLTG